MSIEEFNWLFWFNDSLFWLFVPDNEEENKLELLIFIFGIILVVWFCLDNCPLQEKGFSLLSFDKFIFIFSLFCSFLTPNGTCPIIFGILFGMDILWYPKLILLLFKLLIVVLLLLELSLSISCDINGLISLIL